MEKLSIFKILSMAAKKPVKKNYAKLALALHQKLRGKISVMPNVAVKTKERSGIES